MDKVSEYCIETLRKHGARRILKLLSQLSWFLLPFLIWIQIYQHVGVEYFGITWVSIIGVIVLFLFLAYESVMIIQVRLVIYRIMKHVEHVRRIFYQPQDLKAEEDFRQECSKFLIPYLYTPQFFPSAASWTFHRSILVRVIMLILQVFAHFYISYSTIVFFVANRTLLNQCWIQTYPNIPYSSEITNILLPFIQNSIVPTFLLFVVSLPFSFSSMKSRETSYSVFAPSLLYSTFSVFLRIYFLLVTSLSLLLKFAISPKSLSFKPFTFPTSLRLIMAKSVKNIENRSCNVVKFTHTIEDVRTIDYLKDTIMQQKDVPTLAKAYIAQMIKMADSQAVLKRIRESQPVLYLCTIDERCAIIGTIEYNPEEKMYQGGFLFDNKHVKEQFESIAEIQIEEQKRLKRQMPHDITELIGELSREKEK